MRSGNGSDDPELAYQLEYYYFIMFILKILLQCTYFAKSVKFVYFKLKASKNNIL